jgi:enamine deaminase RidA (YjgF/YER057c/UK114 family)
MTTNSSTSEDKLMATPLITESLFPGFEVEQVQTCLAKESFVMTTNTTTAEDRLAKLGIHLPDAPSPFGAYVPAVQTGNLLFLSGMLATSGHAATVVGIVGKDLDVKAGREAAYTAALNVLALTKKQLGSLNRVSQVVRLGVYVAATPEFTEHPKVADAASELLRDVFGEKTISSRLVFGVASLPLGSPVELEVILEVQP